MPFHSLYICKLVAGLHSVIELLKGFVIRFIPLSSVGVSIFQMISINRVLYVSFSMNLLTQHEIDSVGSEY